MMYCPSCGREIEDGSKFCPLCGATIQQNAASPGARSAGAERNAAPEKKTHRLIWILAILLFAVSMFISPGLGALVGVLCIVGFIIKHAIEDHRYKQIVKKNNTRDLH